MMKRWAMRIPFPAILLTALLGFLRVWVESWLIAAEIVAGMMLVGVGTWLFDKVVEMYGKSFEQ